MGWKVGGGDIEEVEILSFKEKKSRTTCVVSKYLNFFHSARLDCYMPAGHGPTAQWQRASADFSFPLRVFLLHSLVVPKDISKCTEEVSKLFICFQLSQ